MNWFKENPFLAGLAAFVVVGVGALGYLVSQSMSQYQATSEEYSAAVSKLHTLQNRAPFPNDENLQKIKSSEEDYKKAIHKFRNQLAKMQLPLQGGINPQKFQDDLRTAVNDVKTKATEAGVALPQGFYLGFDQYQASLPSEKAAPALARQLEVIKQIINQLIDFKVTAIDDLKRMTLPEEGGSAQANAEQPGGGGGKKNRENSLISRNPLELAFTAEQAKFRVAFNSLLTADQFLVVRTVMVQNSSPLGPPINNPTATTSSTAGTEGAPGDAKNLNVILGRELVKVAIRAEIVNVSAPEAAKK